MIAKYQIISTIIQIARNTLDELSSDDFDRLRQHFGEMYDDGKIVAEIAIKMFLRVSGIEIESDGRSLTPVDALVDRGLKVFQDVG